MEQQVETEFGLSLQLEGDVIPTPGGSTSIDNFRIYLGRHDITMYVSNREYDALKEAFIDGLEDPELARADKLYDDFKDRQREQG